MPDEFERRPLLLHDLVTMVAPDVLNAEGVPVCQTVQNAGEFVVTFPQSYHGGFSYGFNCGEAVNFASADWIPFGHRAIRDYAAQRRPVSLNQEHLLLSTARKERNPETLQYVAHHRPDCGCRALSRVSCAAATRGRIDFCAPAARSAVLTRGRARPAPYLPGLRSRSSRSAASARSARGRSWWPSGSGRPRSMHGRAGRPVTTATSSSSATVRRCRRSAGWPPHPPVRLRRCSPGSSTSATAPRRRPSPRRPSPGQTGPPRPLPPSRRARRPRQTPARWAAKPTGRPRGRRRRRRPCTSRQSP